MNRENSVVNRERRAKQCTKTWKDKRKEVLNPFCDWKKKRKKKEKKEKEDPDNNKCDNNNNDIKSGN